LFPIAARGVGVFFAEIFQDLFDTV
jgi:hypothetical protein